MIGKAINWKGDIDNKTQEDFKSHFENLLNPPDQPLTTDINIDDCPYIPVLDDPIHVDELVRSIKESKAERQAGLMVYQQGFSKYYP